MNKRMVLFVLGKMLVAEAVMMLPGAVLALVYREKAVGAFVAAMGMAVVAGVISQQAKPRDKVIYAREGFIIVSLSWIVLSLFGALPFFLSKAIPSFVDALFETVSGFTTTGASILSDVEALPRGLMYWRSFTHWVGGMGVLVFVMAIMPLAGDRSMHLMRAEVPGPQVGKLVPKLRSTASILYGIYVALTLILVLLLCVGGMNWFDSLLNAFATAGTGGFAIKNASIGAYNSAYIDGVITVFMALFGVNFNLFYLLCIGQVAAAFRSEELWAYLGIMALSILVITLNIRGLYQGIGQALRYASFQVSSIMTTTGFATTDFNQWPGLSKAILLLLMIIGASAGSTGGGIKVSRLLIMVKSIRGELNGMLHPRSVNIVKLDRKRVENVTVQSAHIYFSVYILILLASFLLLSLDGLDLESTLTAVFACINNIGPGLSLVGPMGNFGIFSDFSKLILTLDMLIGRLEIFPMLLLFAPSVWRGAVKKMNSPSRGREG